VEEVLPAARHRGRNLLVFNFDGDHQITVNVFDADMCRRQYVVPARGKPDVSSSDEEDDDQ
jgi:hypothetical protein